MSKLDATTAATWTVSVIETKISASLYLKSPQVKCLFFSSSTDEGLSFFNRYVMFTQCLEGRMGKTEKRRKKGTKRGGKGEEKRGLGVKTS